jgi:hypothetical protein
VRREPKLSLDLSARAFPFSLGVGRLGNRHPPPMTVPVRAAAGLGSGMRWGGVLCCRASPTQPVINRTAPCQPGNQRTCRAA